MVTLKIIRVRLIEAIKASGLTQTELARRLGIGQQTISEYLHGKSMPALDTFANLCIILDVDPAYILCVEDFGGSRVDNRQYTFNTKVHKGNINIK